MAPKLEIITEGSVLGEAPYWDVESQVLYFVDIPGKTLDKYDPATKIHTKVSLAPDQGSFIIPVKGRKNNFVTGLNGHIAIVSWDGQSDKVSVVEKLNSVDSPLLFNDGKVDSTGRLWAGSLYLDPNDTDNTQPLGSLYSIDSTRKLRVHRRNIKISNGLEWDDQTKKFYYTDSLKYDIDRYDFDPATGTLSNEQVWFSLKKHNIPGTPDGITIDTDGNIWVAVFGGGRVLKIDGKKPQTLLETIFIPAILVTSVAFGGKNLDELFVTTAAIEYKDATREFPRDGATYRVTGTGVTGKPPNEFIVKS